MRNAGLMGGWMSAAALAMVAGTAAQAEDGAREVVMQCDGGKSISVAFAETTATLRIRDVTILLDAQEVASGLHYAGGGHDLRGKGAEMVWSDPTGNIRMCRDQDAQAQPAAETPVAAGLADSAWTLVHFQSPDDAIGTVVPPRANRYGLRFDPDGTLVLRLDCNRSTATWTAEPTSDSAGGLSIGPAAMTRAACGEGAIDVQLAQDMARVRTYTLAEDRLTLTLEADAGAYVWKAQRK